MTGSADAHKRQTLVATSTDGGLKEARAYDAADNVVALGPASNNPPNFCRASGGSDGANGALSRLCAQFGYDRAERLRQVDLFADATSTSPIRACIDYDKRGNVSRVLTGCNEYSSCNFEASQPWTCGGGSENEYVTDDFGNLVEVRLSAAKNRSMYGGDLGTFRFEFDAQGNIVKRQTEQQRGTSYPEVWTHYEYTYDFLGRQTSYVLKPSHDTATILSTTVYDVSASVPWDCPQPVRTAGRVSLVADPFITRWYQYDELGRTTREVRVVTGATTCVGAMTLSMTYSANGNVTSMTYGYGRHVQYEYGDGGATDRPTSVSAAFFVDSDGGTENRTVVDSVAWEPFGGLRSYRMRFPVDAGLVASVDYEAGAGTDSLSNWCPTTAIGEESDQSGRLRSLRVHDDSTSLYRRTYQWKADQVQRISSCYLGDSNVITEDYSQATGRGYDGLQRLLGGVDPGFGSNPGPMEERRYSYDSRGNITNAVMLANQTGYSFTYSGSRPDWLTQVAASYGNYVMMEYDFDGQVNRIVGPSDSSGAPSSDISFLYSEVPYGGPAADGVFRVANILTPPTSSYVSYTYWYDSARRRQMKLHPFNARMDIYLYDLGHQLLESHGFHSIANAAPYPTDEYLWLGGRPIAVFRATFDVLGDGSKRHRADDSTLSNCGRPGDPGASEARCGLYFLITDHLSKPVLTLNESRLIAGVGEYEPYGTMNRTQKWWETPNPVPADAGPDSFSHTMKELGGMEVDMRVHFPMMDTDEECDWGFGAAPRDVVYLKDSSSNVLETLGGRHRGDTWSNWHAIPSAGSSNRPLTIEWAPEPGTCSQADWRCGSGCINEYGGGSGASIREVEYQRYQTGAAPFFPALRFPGHHWDAETDLYENWHRYYSPFRHGYLSPEPLLQSPAYVRRMAQTGMSVPTYAYAANNPLAYTDPNGLFVIKGGNECEQAAIRDAIEQLRKRAKENQQCGGEFANLKKNWEDDFVEGQGPTLSLESGLRTPYTDWDGTIHMIADPRWLTPNILLHEYAHNTLITSYGAWNTFWLGRRAQEAHAIGAENMCYGRTWGGSAWKKTWQFPVSP